MEDLYGDLNNYDDVNSVEELRNENAELKVKLQEYAAAMEKLQKDYDTLEMEFKKLENNYSSLLKTARSEIERKTQRISQLNIEKDMMILDALKNGKKIRRNYNKAMPNPSNLKEKPINQNVFEDKPRNYDVKTDSIDSSAHPAKEMLPLSSTYNRSNNVNRFEAESYHSRKNNYKENVVHHNENYDTCTLKAPPSSIKNRRKSMPAESMPMDKITSDEDQEKYYRTKDRTEQLPMNKFEGRNLNRTDRFKTSETSSLDERGAYYHDSSSKDNFRERPSRHYDSSAYRGHDKYEVSLKHRRNYSPERGHKRQYRDYQEDYRKKEKEQGRYRVLESPPPESYSRYQRRNQDHRSNNDRYSYNQDKYRQRHDEKYSIKHKVSGDYDEPQTKRQKIDSCNSDTYYKEDRWQYDKVSTPEFSPHEYDTMRFSCQSPDSIHTDAGLVHPIKEIMATAATPLDDPRLTSKKYFIKMENGREILSTTISRNIDIKPVDKIKWNIKSVKMPDALVNRPSQYSDELVKNIYMDIDDNPGSNLSEESGEVRSDSDIVSLEINSNAEEMHGDVASKKVTEELASQPTSILNVATPSFGKYRIPKIGHNKNKADDRNNVPIIDSGENVPHDNTSHVNKEGAPHDIISKKPLSKEHKNKGIDDLHTTNVNDTKKADKGQNPHHITKMPIIPNVTLRDDLELSDDNSDNMDTDRLVVADKERKIKDATNDESTNTESHSHNVSPHSNATGKIVDTTETKCIEENEKSKESGSDKKQKSKNKKLKPKEASTELVDSTDASHVLEKKTRSKKEKECKLKETKEKFSDLFGDSCSLMTPEDLGLPTYVALSEDAQDAVDMKISQIIDSPPLVDSSLVTGHIVNKNKSKENEKQGASLHDKTIEEILPKSNTAVKPVSDAKKKKFSKRKDEAKESDKHSPSDVFKNLKSATISMKPDIVKTVIISSGVQPELTLNNKTVDATAEVDLKSKPTTTDIDPIAPIMDFQKLNLLKALATSTPHKELHTLDTVESEATKSEVICDSDVGKTVAVRGDDAEQASNADTNTSDTHDAPDVRIFVKRRRKLVKRPPMT